MKTIINHQHMSQQQWHYLQTDVLSNRNMLVQICVVLRSHILHNFQSPTLLYLTPFLNKISINSYHHQYKAIQSFYITLLYSHLHTVTFQILLINH